LNGDYSPRDFCTQYSESDLQFFQRLCAEERLHYHFEHSSRGHCLIVSDALASACRAPTLVFQDDSEPPAGCRFDVQVGVKTPPVAEGRTDLMTLRSGQLMPLAGHPVREWNHLWRLIRVEHQGGQDPSQPYANTIRAVPWGAPLVASQGPAKPRMLSLQRAWVVDVAQAQAQTDPSRPVAVQFDWLYQGEGAKPGHCWLPLAPELNGAAISQWRAGVEVVVSFIEGDPDQPLIIGQLQSPSAEVIDVPTPPSTHVLPAVDGLLSLLQSSEPLVLLCLLPGGGSFSHCREPVCTCRAATLFGQSGAA
jgi:type VI secretion system secreted protein VgrG